MSIVIDRVEQAVRAGAERFASMTRPVLLGEAPSANGRGLPGLPLSGTAAQTLVRLAGFPTSERLDEPVRSWLALVERFQLLNAIERREDAYPWSARRAGDRWTRWLLTRPEAVRHEPLTVVCLGRRAAGAVGLRPDRPWGEWLEAGLLTATVIPHPSGRNLVLNDPSMRELVGRVLRTPSREV